MLNSAVLISRPAPDVPAPTLPPFTDTLSVSQRVPRITVAIGLTVAVASGVAGLVVALAGGL